MHVKTSSIVTWPLICSLRSSFNGVCYFLVVVEEPDRIEGVASVFFILFSWRSTRLIADQVKADNINRTFRFCVFGTIKTTNHLSLDFRPSFSCPWDRD